MNGHNNIIKQKEATQAKRKLKQAAFALALSWVTLFFAQNGTAQGSQTFSTAGTFTNGFTVPAGVYSITVQVWGGGGGGGQDAANNGEPGGGGGAYASSILPVTPGVQFTVVVGAGGTPTNGGGQSAFGSLVIALGGGSSTTTAAGTGGQASGSTGDVKHSGGNGGIGSGNTTGTGGSGGGSSASAGADGVTGSNFSGTTGGAGGNGPDGDGGRGGNNGVNNDAQPGTAPGGGGGGRGDTGGSSASGAKGEVLITWVCPAATISYGSSSLCTASTSAPVIITGTTGGIFSTVPATGLSINGSGEINPSASTEGNYTVHYIIAASTGCTAVDATAAVAIHKTPTSTATGTNITCNGASDGIITVTGSGGISPYTFSINDGTYTAGDTGDTKIYNGLSPDTPYQVKVKDTNGCISK